MVESGDVLVSIDARHANQLTGAILRSKESLLPLPADGWRNEVTIGRSRFDFARIGEPLSVVEAKCVTLVVDGVARFPDAPTPRGARHLRELAELAKGGAQAAALFVIQRPDAEAFGSNEATDPAFRDALKAAIEAGVRVRAFTCEVTTRAVSFSREVSVLA